MSETAGSARDTRWLALVVLCAGMLMIILDGDDRHRRAALDPETTSASRSRASPGW